MLKIIIGIAIGGAIGAGMGYFGKCTSGACPLTATPWRGSIYGACLGALVVFLVGGGRGASENIPPEVQEAGQKLVVHITSDTDFEEVISDPEKPVLVDMYADWCSPCRTLAPAIDKLAFDYKDKAVVAKLNVDKVPGPPNTHGVSGIPAVFIFYRGEVKATLTGVNHSSVYAEAIDTILSQASSAEK